MRNIIDDYRIVNPIPDSLDKLLGQILNPSHTAQGHQEFLAAVEAVRQSCVKNTYYLDQNVWIIARNGKTPKKEAYYFAYIDFLGKCLYHHQRSENDIAWYYYAQSRYYKGLLNAWDSVYDQVAKDEIKREARRKGGLNKGYKQTGAMKDELIRIIKSPPPPGKWQNPTQLLEVAIPKLQEFQRSTNQELPLDENLPERVRSWLINDGRVIDAYYDYGEIGMIDRTPSDPDRHY